jgi:uncharacterized protein (DUF433 family)
LAKQAWGLAGQWMSLTMALARESRLSFGLNKKNFAESLQRQPEITMGQLDRIASDPAIFGGKPIVRGMRISVELIVNLLAQGESQEAVLEDYPGLTPEDIRACLAYAHTASMRH